MDEHQQAETVVPTVGKLVKRFVYPDGRLTATVSVGPDWKVEVFPSVEAALQFAKDHNLKVEEITE